MADENRTEAREFPVVPLEIYKNYLKNSNTAESYEARILWGIRKKEPLPDLFAGAVELVGKLMDDPSFSADCCAELEKYR